MGDQQEFSIPEPRVPDSSSAVGQISRAEAEKESKDFSGRFSPAFHDHYDWVLRFLLRPMLFIFIIVLNAWWDWNVKNLIWQAGRTGTGFHLDNSVLIALITTSMANFLAIVAIVARHLFPNPK